MLIVFLLVVIFSIPFLSPKFLLVLVGIKEMAIKGFDRKSLSYPILLFLISLCLFIYSPSYSEYRVLKLTTVVFLSTIFSRFFWTKMFKSRLAMVYFIISSIFFINVSIFSTMEDIPEFNILGMNVFRGSYHNLWFIGLILLFQKSIKNSLSFWDVLLFLIFSILSTGRTSILMGVLVFMGWVSWWFWTSRFKRMVWLISPVLLLISIVFTDVVVNSSKGLSERGLKLIARQYIYGCYMENLKYENILLGFHPNDIAKDCLIALEREDAESKIVMTESSLLSLISYLGIFSLIPLYRLFSIMTEIDMVSRVVFLALLVRILTGDFLFFTVWDFIWITGTKYFNDEDV